MRVVKSRLGTHYIIGPWWFHLTLLRHKIGWSWSLYILRRCISWRPVPYDKLGN